MKFLQPDSFRRANFNIDNMGQQCIIADLAFKL